MTTAITTTEKTNEPLDARELFCGECGYGIVVRRDPPECPMCRTTSWSTRAGFARWN
jgi:rubrerythrin